MMTNPGQIAQQMMDFQKMTFAGFYDALTLAQDQAASTMTMTLDQAAWLPPEGRKAILSWMDACQEGREQFKSLVQESFSSMELCFDLNKTAPVVKKAGKKASCGPKKAPVETAQKEITTKK
jgi:hypothetical protein